MQIFVSTVSAKSESILGMLEYTQNDQAEAALYPVVRVLFRKSGKDWTAFKHECGSLDCLESITKEFPSETRWAIAFDGRVLGLVTARTPSKFKFYSEIGCQEISPNEKAPKVGELSNEFSTWMKNKSYRPIVAVSPANFADPDHWKSIQVSLSKKLRANFLKQYPTCECKEFGDRKCTPLKYSPNKIVVKMAYASSKQWKLIVLKLNCSKQFNRIEATYAIKKDGSFIHLGRRLKLVDTGDYDNDGSSELIFASSDYNYDSYILYYDNFLKHVEFGWSYQ